MGTKNYYDNNKDKIRHSSLKYYYNNYYHVLNRMADYYRENGDKTTIQ